MKALSFFNSNRNENLIGSVSITNKRVIEDRNIDIIILFDFFKKY